MPKVSDCLKLAGLPPEERAALDAAIAEYQTSDGLNTRQAALRAAEDALRALQQEREDILAQVRAQAAFHATGEFPAPSARTYKGIPVDKPADEPSAPTAETPEAATPSQRFYRALSDGSVIVEPNGKLIEPPILEGEAFFIAPIPKGHESEYRNPAGKVQRTTHWVIHVNTGQKLAEGFDEADALSQARAVLDRTEGAVRAALARAPVINAIQRAAAETKAPEAKAPEAKAPSTPEPTPAPTPAASTPQARGRPTLALEPYDNTLKVKPLTAKHSPEGIAARDALHAFRQRHHLPGTGWNNRFRAWVFGKGQEKALREELSEHFEGKPAGGTPEAASGLTPAQQREAIVGKPLNSPAPVPYTPKDGWESNLLKAREYAAALGLDTQGLDLEALVVRIRAHLGEGTARDLAPLADNEVKLPDNPFIYRKDPDGKWAWRPEGAETASGWLTDTSPLLQELEDALAQKKASAPGPQEVLGTQPGDRAVVLGEERMLTEVHVIAGVRYGLYGPYRPDQNGGAVLVNDLDAHTMVSGTRYPHYKDAIAAYRDLLAKAERMEQPSAPAPEPSPTPGEKIPPPQPAAKPFGADNKLVTRERAEEIKARLRAKLNQQSAGVDPELLALGTELSVYYLEGGIRKFADYAKQVLADLGEAARPYLRSWYEGARYFPGLDASGMSTPAEVEAYLAVQQAMADHGITPTAPTSQGESTDDQADPSAGLLRPDLPQHPEGAQPQGAGAPAPGGHAGEGSGGVRGDVSGRGDETGDGGDAGAPRGRLPRDRAGGRTGAQRGARGADAGRGGDGEPNARNYRIDPRTTALAQGGWKERARANLEAIRTLKRLSVDAREATDAEKDLLVQYVGWGASELANGIFPRIERDYSKWDATARRYPTREIYKDDAWKALGEELKALLSEEEYAQARASTTNAHYTSPQVIRAMYKALTRFGFKGGRVLEPGSGVGHFIGLLPEKLAATTHYTGVELDATSAAITQALYPDARIEHQDFTGFKRPEGFFDAALGNPPFADIVIEADPKYREHRFKLHDYFIAKTVDLVRPGGIVMLVTSRFTMDKQDSAARSYLAARADLLGAIRLPQSAFLENAGTEVVTDVLFLRKREPGAAPHERAIAPEVWRERAEVTTAEGEQAHVNGYFAAHPEMVLGEHSSAGTMYHRGSYTVTPRAGVDIEQAFAEAVAHLPTQVMGKPAAHNPQDRQVEMLDLSPDAVKENAFYLKDGMVYQKRDGVGHAHQARSRDELDLLRHYVGLRDALLTTLHTQLKGEDASTARAALNAAYDTFVQAHGPLNKEVRKSVKRKAEDGTRVETVQVSNPNLRPLGGDPDRYRVASIEAYDADTGTATKRQVFQSDVINPDVQPNIATPVDALHVSLHRLGRVDLDDVAELAGLSVKDTLASLGEALFENPETHAWETAEEYLSGPVRKKLEYARAAAEDDPRYARNVRALEGAQPHDLTPSQVYLGLGMPFIEAPLIEQFAREKLNLTVSISHFRQVGSWTVTADKHERQKVEAVADWGTPSLDAVALLDVALNNRGIRLYKTETDPTTGKDRRVYDPAATAAALAKRDKLRAAFEEWVRADEPRLTGLVALYNQIYNDAVPRNFGGPHIQAMVFPGMSAAKVPFDHQKRVAWRIITSGNTYMAHGVGAGKTLASILAGMELKRLGLKKKPLWVVPRHMLKQFATEFLEAYPAAKILVADEENFSAAERNRFMGRISAENWDGIIITHSAFGKMPIDAASVRHYLERDLDEMRAFLATAKAEKSRVRTKQIERVVKQMQQRLDKLLTRGGQDAGVSFEETGVDMLFVDEAHEFRKLDFATHQTSMRGINPLGSQRAMDLYLKAKYLEGKHPGHALVMMSGTPLTNTLAEIFTIQRFLQEGVLEERGLHKFDAWASTFGDMVSELQQLPSGQYAPVTRFGRFRNMRDLSRLWAEVGDVVRTRDLPYIKLPKVKGGGRQVILGTATAAMKDYKQRLAARIDHIRAHRGPPQKGDDIILSVITDGRHAALDERFIDPALPASPEYKLEKCIQEVYDTWKATEADKLTQMVFADLGLPQALQARGFSVYTYLREQWVKRGIPREQIAFIQDYQDSNEKLKLFRDMNEGRVRILLGSSAALATGVNAQRRLVALHHLDADSYLPANIEQREGRAIRQGNLLAEPEYEAKYGGVALKVYLTQGSYDETMWQFIETKQRAIDQFLAGTLDMDEMTDIDGAADQYAELKALSSDNPLVLERAQLELELTRLHTARRNFEDEQALLRGRLRGAQKATPELKAYIDQLEAAVKATPDLSGDKFEMEVAGVRLTERKAAGEALRKAVRKVWQEAIDKTKADEIKAPLEKKVGRIGGQVLTVKALAEWKTELTAEQIRKLWQDGGEEVLKQARTLVVRWARLTREEPVHGLSVNYGSDWRDHKYLGTDPDIAEWHDETGFQALPEESELGLVARTVNSRASYTKRLAEARELLAMVEKREQEVRERLGATFQYDGQIAEKQQRLHEVEDALQQQHRADDAQTQAVGELTPEDLQDDEAADDDPRLSRAPAAPAKNSLSVEALRAGLEQEFGRKAAARLLEQDIVRLVASVEDLPERLRSLARAQRAQGLYDSETDTTYLIADHIEGGNVRGVLYHELGTHYGLEKVLGPEKYRELLAQFRRLERWGNPAARKARERAREAGSPKWEDEESIGYLAEDPANHDMPFVRRLFAAVRAFLFRHGLLVKNLTVDDIVAVVRGAAHRVARPDAPSHSRSVNTSEVLGSQPSFDDSAIAGLTAEQLRSPKVVERARRLWVEQGVKSPFFKRWFGDWELASSERALSVLASVDVPTRYTGTLSAVRDSALADYHALRKAHPEGFPAPALDNRTQHGEQGLVRLQSNEKFAARTGDTRKFQIISELPTLLRSAVWYGEQPPHKRSQVENVRAYHYLVSKARIGGQAFDVAFLVREDNNGNFHHNHTLYRESGTHASWADVEGPSALQGPSPAAIVPDDLSLYRPRPRINPDAVSQVVDAKGAPQVVYHGTDRDLTEFRAEAARRTVNPARELGFFFTADPDYASDYAGAGKGANLMPVYLAVKRPYRTRLQDLMEGAKREGGAALKARLEAEGYDGIIAEGLGGLTEYVAFRPEQVKSAVGNSGLFDGTNPDIRLSRAPTPNGSLSPSGNAAAVQQRSRNALGEQARAVVNQVKRLAEGWSPLGTLPEKAEYLASRYRALGNIAKTSEIARGVYDALRTVSEADAKNVYDYLTQAGASELIIQDPTVRAKAREVKAQIDGVGRTLVNRGLLSEEAYEAHKGSYLPRVYLKYLLPEDAITALGTGRKPTNMGYLKARKDIPEEVRRLILGEITDPAYLASRALGVPMRDVALLDWLEQIAGNEQWVLPGALVEWKGKHVTPFYLKSEAERIRKQAPHLKDSADQEAARQWADAMDEVANKALEDRPDLEAVPKGYQKMPNTHRYGALRGLIVRKEIHDDVVGSFNLVTGDQSIAEQILGTGGMVSKLTGAWKWAKVAANPPAQVRNFISNGVLLHLSGVRAHMIIPRLIEAVREIRTNGQYWQVAKKYGVTESTFAAQEMIRINRELLDLERRQGKTTPLGTLKILAGRLMDKTSDLYQLSESLFKTAKIIDAMKRGASEEEAALDAQAWLFDYSLVTPSVRYLRNAPIGAPFLCVDEATEILTTQGWKTLDQVSVGNSAASFNMRTQRLEWKPVLDVYRADYGGRDLLYVEDRHLDMAMTPDHRCVTYRRRRVPGKRAENTTFPSLEIVKAEELNTRDMIPTAARFDHVPVGEPVSDALVALVGWYVTEGWDHSKCAQVWLAQNEGAKADSIRVALRAAGFTWREESRRFANGNAEHIRFNIHAEHGRVLRGLAPDKELRPEFLMRLTTEQIERLVNVMIVGDGHVTPEGERRFIQNPGVTLETFQMALMMLGISYSVRPHNSNGSAVLLRAGKRYSTKRARFERRPYQGRIWCPMVADNQTWVARRNGKPFITHNTFTIKVLPRMLEVATKHPLRFAPYVVIPYVMAQMIASLYDVDDDDLKALKLALPEWLQKKGHAYLLPAKDEHGRWQAIDLGYFLPWTSWTELVSDIGEGEVKDAIRASGLIGGPLPDLITAIKTGKDPFTQKDIVNEYDPPAKKLSSLLGYLYTLSMPTWLTDIGFAGHLYKAVTDAVDKEGQPTDTEAQALLRLLGVNVYPIEPTRARARNIDRQKFEIARTKARMTELLKDRNLTPERRTAIRQEYQGMIRERQQALLEYARQSRVNPKLLAPPP